MKKTGTGRLGLIVMKTSVYNTGTLIMFLHSSFFTYILFDAEQDVVLSTIYQQRSSGHFNTDHETWKSS